ncbi:hypothetical protein M3Y95_00927800 [Aphelenchoides besseyi]|nr:hypothetical protein M3Y95_00927800 [Aphelenchoides besseyi]
MAKRTLLNVNAQPFVPRQNEKGDRDVEVNKQLNSPPPPPSQRQPTIQPVTNAGDGSSAMTKQPVVQDAVVKPVVHNDIEMDQVIENSEDFLTSTEELESLEVGQNNMQVRLIVKQIHAPKMGGKTGHLVSTVLVSNESGGDVLIEAWRSDADRLIKDLRIGHLATFTTLRVAEVLDKYNLGSVPFKLVFANHSEVDNIIKHTKDYSNLLEIKLVDSRVTMGKYRTFGFIKIVPKLVGGMYYGQIVNEDVAVAIQLSHCDSVLSVGAEIELIGLWKDVSIEVIEYHLTGNSLPTNSPMLRNFRPPTRRRHLD